MGRDVIYESSVDSNTRPIVAMASMCVFDIRGQQVLSLNEKCSESGFPNYKRLCSQWKVHPVDIPHKHDHGRTLQFLPKSVPDVEIGEGKDKVWPFPQPL
jgi:hypothetical protein